MFGQSSDGSVYRAFHEEAGDRMIYLNRYTYCTATNTVLRHTLHCDKTQSVPLSQYSVLPRLYRDTHCTATSMTATPFSSAGTNQLCRWSPIKYPVDPGLVQAYSNQTCESSGK